MCVILMVLGRIFFWVDLGHFSHITGFEGIFVIYGSEVSGHFRDFKGILAFGKYRGIFII